MVKSVTVILKLMTSTHVMFVNRWFMLLYLFENKLIDKAGKYWKWFEYVQYNYSHVNDMDSWVACEPLDCVFGPFEYQWNDQGCKYCGCFEYVD